MNRTHEMVAEPGQVLSDIETYTATLQIRHSEHTNIELIVPDYTLTVIPCVITSVTFVT